MTTLFSGALVDMTWVDMKWVDVAWVDVTWVSRLGWVLVHFLWQGTLIAGLYRTLSFHLHRPQIRYNAACFALLAMLAAPAATFLSDGRSGFNDALVSRTPVAATHSEWSTTPTTIVSVHQSVDWQDRFLQWVVAAWFVGVMIFGLRLTGGCIVAARVRSMHVRPAPTEWQRRLDELRLRLRVSAPVRLLVSAIVSAPAVVGWLRPVILMPVGALAGLPAEHIEAFLAHELAHIRRRDYLVNLVQSAAETLLFYHPAVWWISRQIREEREHCCDDAAVFVTGNATDYAQALLNLETCRPAHQSLAMAASGGSLSRRISRLVGRREPNARPASTPTALAAGVLLVFAAAAVFGQSFSRGPEFEIASIKPSPPEYIGFQSYIKGDRYTAMTATVRNLMSFAYGIRDFQISGGTGWPSTVGYNVSAKMPAGAAPDQAKPMMQQLLAERFRLKFHRVTENRAGYALVVDKTGLKVPESKNPGPGLGFGRGALYGKGADMGTLSKTLSERLDAPIANRTGVKGLYDFTLTWTPDEESGETPGLSLFTALREQLGLRLDPVKNVPVEFFIIDHVERPTEN
jgi:uncharacterized protein (TIGR03435 family)